MKVMKLRFSEYIRNVLETGTGIAIAQAIPIVVTPFLTRLYSPAQFGVFAVFMALGGILTTVATGRYEFAIVMPRSNRRALAVLMLSLFTCLASMATLFTIIFIGGILISKAALSDAPIIGELGLLLLWVPGIAFLNAVLRSLTVWNGRQKEFRRVAVSRFIQSATAAIISVVAVSFSGSNGNGLILGATAGSVAGIAMLLPGLRGMSVSFRGMARLRLLLREARSYINYPKISLWSGLINALAWRLPMLVFPMQFGMVATGQLSIAYRIVGIPSQMVGRAFRDVFQQKAAADYGRDGNCLAVYLKTLKILTGLSIAFFMPLILFGSDLFPLIFGPEWGKSGEFVETLSIMFAVGFVVSPLAFVLTIANRQSWDLMWQILFAGATATALAIGAWAGSADITVKSLAVLGLTSYLIYFGASYRTASHGVARRISKSNSQP